MRLVLALAAIALIASGCSTPAVPAQDEARTVPRGTWSTRAYDGEFLATKVVNPEVATPNQFDVPEGTLRAWFNLTLDATLPGEVTVRYVWPDCPEFQCIQETPAPGGRLDRLVERPAAGLWNLIFFAPDGAQSGTYRLQVASLGPADP